MGEEKRRRLRLHHDASTQRSALLDFDAGHALLSLNEPLLLDDSPPHAGRTRYTTCAGNEPVVTRMPPMFRPPESPGRRPRSAPDPLADDVYAVFHKRMKKDERSVALADKSKLYFDIDNVRGQSKLLNQHDWVKHLLSMVVLRDRNDYAELARKRQLVWSDIQRTLGKFADWEARSAAHAATVKNYLQGNIGLGDEDDADALILTRPVASLAKERAALRIAQHGTPVRLVLRNGYDLLAMPHRKPRIVPTGTT
ncbi:hypothetical protein METBISCDRAFT_27458 [Metschnikowia bicuspidata]|uniref:Something about silencing protein 4 domain-containing protein n=1 Tax=Metschnikowia bicuspidata TaxID=27322 RepID=A0A4P9ZEL5_9ASCO|nr:hypothetical protein METBISCDRAFT_27458 [Metschnikowia bicuspidata]